MLKASHSGTLQGVNMLLGFVPTCGLSLLVFDLLRLWGAIGFYGLRVSVGLSEP